MKEVLAFDDVTLEPQTTSLDSRSQVDISTTIAGMSYALPIISAPMDTVIEERMAAELTRLGAAPCLHRFSDAERIAYVYNYANNPKTWVSVGLKDFEKMQFLKKQGINNWLLDVAHGAQEQVVRWVHDFRKLYPNDNLMVGNFATGKQIDWMINRLGSRDMVNTWRIGVASGAACSTRVQTGHGIPTLTSLLSCKGLGVELIADGGIKTGGDVTKALAAGASAVMVGSLLAACEESPGQVFYKNAWGEILTLEQAADKIIDPNTGELMPLVEPDMPKVKAFRGSASKASYNVQNKTGSYFTAEGAEMHLPYKGKTEELLNELMGGLRSGLMYSGVATIKELQQKAVFAKLTHAGYIEGTPHGKART